MGILDWSNHDLTDDTLLTRLKNRPDSESYDIVWLDDNRLRGIPRIFDLPQFYEIFWASLRNNHIVVEPLFQVSDLVCHVQILDLAENHIQSIPNLKNCVNLKTLDMSGNKIENVDERYLPETLEIFNISGNNLKAIPNLTQLINLEDLDVSKNKISNVDGEHIPGSLKIFNLSGNKLKAIPNLINSQHLEDLNVSQNNIEVWKSTLPMNLHSLHLQYNKLDAFPDFQNFTELKYLDISNNEIDDFNALYIPKELETLKCSRNRLTNIPHLEYHSSLKSLNLSRNKIDTVQIGHMPNSLSVLHLSNNVLRGLPDLRNLSLAELDVDNNHIEHVEGLPKTLSVFSICNNRLESMPNMAEFQHNCEIFFSGNRIERIDVSFLPCKLSLLSLSHNLICEIPNLSERTLLQKLDLSYNQVEQVSQPHLPSSIISVDLSNNNLESLRSIREKPTIDIRNNPIKEFGRDCFQVKKCYDILMEMTDEKQIQKLQIPPPAVFLGGYENVCEYFRSMQDTENSFITSANRVFLVGPPEVGKTSLLDTMISGNPSLTGAADRTRLVDVKHWQINAGTSCTVFDQGGHPIYSIVNELFVSQKSVVFVTDSILNAHEASIETEIRRTIYQDVSSDIHVVLTHADEARDQSEVDNMKECCQSKIHDLLKTEKEIINVVHDEQEAGELVQLYNDLLSKLKCFVVSSKDMHGITDLKQFLSDLLDSRQVQVSVKWLTCYMNLKFCDESDVVSDTITLQEFQQMYDNSELMNSAEGSLTDEAKTCLKYFHDAGFVIWKHQSESLKNTIVRNLNFIVDTLKAILYHDIEKVLPYDKTSIPEMTKTDYDRAVKRYTDEGLITSQLIRTLLKKKGLQQNVSDVCIELLKERNICHEIGTSDSEEFILYFPWLIRNKNKPESIDCSMQIDERVMSVKLECIFLHTIPPNICERMSVCIQKYAYLNHYLGERHAWSGGFCAKIAEIQCFVFCESAKKICLCLKGDLDNLDTLWLLFAIFEEKFREILGGWMRLVEYYHIVCSHCEYKKIPNPEKRHRNDVFPTMHSENITKVECPKEPGSSVPEAMIVCLTSIKDAEKQQEAAKAVKDYLKRDKENAFKGSGELKCARNVDESSLHLNWMWNDLAGGQILRGTKIRYRLHTENNWTFLPIVQKDIRLHEIQGTNNNGHYIIQVGPVFINKNEPDFYVSHVVHAVSDQEVHAGHIMDLEKWHTEFSQMKHVELVLSKLKSAGKIPRQSWETLRRSMHDLGPFHVAESILEHIYRASTYHTLYVFWQILMDSGQVELAKQVPVMLVDGQLINDLQIVEATEY